MNWNNNTVKRYMEIGLAVLLVLTIGLAGASGVLSRGKAAPGQTAQEHKETSGNAKGAGDTDGAAGSDSASGDTAETDSGKTQDDSGNEDVKEAIASGQYPIMGSSSVTVQDMVDYFNESGREYPAEELSGGGADSIETFCQMYYDEAAAEGVRPEVAFAQTMKETGFLQYGGDASIEQFNFAGLGTTGNGVPGNSYPDVQTGIRAQIQHLKAYATSDALNQECVDDRYEYVKKGSAPYVQWLGQQENPEGLGWATGDDYGYDIVGMIEAMTEE